ncbi:MAG TPA: hypothetical protein VND93_02470, partial [Myxococcales bacterium]|nr:hypothetical protein [Myxococcales bacterium]
VHRERQGALEPMGYPFEVAREKKPICSSDQVYDRYLRQVGWVSAVLSLVAPGDDVCGFLLGCRYAFAALTSLAAAGLIAALSWRLGIRAAAGAAAATAASNWFADFSRSLYWTPFLALAAVGWCWFGFGRVRPRVLWAVFAGLVALKCLNGYEHVTAVLLAPLAVIAFELPDRRALRPAVAAVAAGLAGFAAAFAVHVVYLWTAVGRELALANTFGKAWQRSVGQPVPLRDQLRGAYGVFAHDHVLAAVVGIWLVAAALGWRRARPLALSSAVALAGAASWLVLARSHVALAPMFNMLPFYFGAVMLLGACSAEVIGGWVQRK